MLEHTMEAVSAVVTSFNPTPALSDTIEGLLSAGFSHIVLVDDGSKPETQCYFEAAAHRPEVTLLRHKANQGRGAALKTAFAWLLEHRPSCAGVVTVDDAGGHHPEDALTCANQMLAEQRVILGCRDLSLPQVPFLLRMGNWGACTMFKFFCGMTLTDTWTGLRAIPGAYLPVLTAVAGAGDEYETNMLLTLKDQHIPWSETKIRAIRQKENRGFHFRSFCSCCKIYLLILAHFFRYAASSVVSAVADSGLFALLTVLLAPLLSGTALNAAATAGARALSSLLNFTMNRRLVFRSNGPLLRSMARYYTLALPTLAAQFLLTEGLFRLLQIGDSQPLLRTVVYTGVMAVLFVSSYAIQRHWVFAAERGASQQQK